MKRETGMRGFGDAEAVRADPHLRKLVQLLCGYEPECIILFGSRARGEADAYSQARADLEVVRTLYAGKHYAAACFHAQQAGEKALKAVLFSQGQRRVLEHSIRELARLCQEHEPA